MDRIKRIESTGKNTSKEYKEKKRTFPQGALFGGVPTGTFLPYKKVSSISNIQKHAHSPLTARHASAGTGKYEK